MDAIPAKGSVRVDDPQRIKRGVHHLSGAQQVQHDWDAQIRYQNPQRHIQHAPDQHTCPETQSEENRPRLQTYTTAGETFIHQGSVAFIKSDSKTLKSYKRFLFICEHKNINIRYNYLNIWNLRVQRNLNIEKIIYKVVQMKFLAMHITNQKFRFDIFTVGNLQNIFYKCLLNILMIFGIK